MHEAEDCDQCRTMGLQASAHESIDRLISFCWSWGLIWCTYLTRRVHYKQRSGMLGYTLIEDMDYRWYNNFNFNFTSLQLVSLLTNFSTYQCKVFRVELWSLIWRLVQSTLSDQGWSIWLYIDRRLGIQDQGSKTSWEYPRDIAR